VKPFTAQPIVGEKPGFPMAPDRPWADRAEVSGERLERFMV